MGRDGLWSHFSMKDVGVFKGRDYILKWTGSERMLFQSANNIVAQPQMQAR